MNIRQLMIAGASLVLAVTSTYCTNGGPTPPPPPPLPIPDLVVDFPGAQMEGSTVTIFEGDSLGCNIALSPSTDKIVVGWNYDGKVVACTNVPGKPRTKRMAYFLANGAIYPTLGTHTLEFLLQLTGGTVVQTVIYTLVVMPRPG